MKNNHPYMHRDFAALALAEALKLNASETKPFDFSNQSREAVNAAFDDPSLASVALACRLVASELEGSEAMETMAKKLSLVIAMPTRSRAGRPAVAYPTLGSALSLAAVDGKLDDFPLYKTIGEEHLREARANNGESDVEGWRASSALNSAGLPAASLSKNAGALFNQRARGEWLSADWAALRQRRVDELQKESYLAYGAQDHAKVQALGRDIEAIRDTDTLWERDGRSDRAALNRVREYQRELMAKTLGERPDGRCLFDLALGYTSSISPQEPMDDIPSSEGLLRLASEALIGDDMANLLTEQESQGPIGLLRSRRAKGNEEVSSQERQAWQAVNGGAQAPHELSWLSSFLVKAKPFYESLSAPLPESWGADGSTAYLTSAIQTLYLGSLYAYFAPPESEVAMGLEKSVDDFIQRMEPLNQKRKSQARGGLAAWDPASNALANHAESWGEIAEKAKKVAAKISVARTREPKGAFDEAGALIEARKEKDKAGVGALMDLADQSFLGALSVAQARESSMFVALGFNAAAGALEDGHKKSDKLTPSLSDLRRAERDAALAREGDPLKTLVARYADAAHSRGQPLTEQAAMAALCELAPSKERLEAFSQSEPGLGYGGFLEAAAARRGDIRQDLSDGLGWIFLAAFQEFKNPSPTASPLASSDWGPSVIEALWNQAIDLDYPNIVNYPKAAKKDQTTASLAKDVAYQVKRGLALGLTQLMQWDIVFKAIGLKEGLSFFEKRREAALEQCPAAARWAVDGVLGREPADPAPTSRLIVSLKREGEGFVALPYGFEPDSAVIGAILPKRVSAGDAIEDEEVKEILAKEGFAGQMALAAKVFYQDIETREGADARGRANAWIAAGKRLAKESLGLSDASFKAAHQHEGSAKRLMSLVPGLLKTRLAARAVMEGSAKESVVKTGSADNRKARRLGELLAQASARGIGAAPAFIVSEAITPGDPSAGDLNVDFAYLISVLKPMESGADVSQVVSMVRREAAAREAFSERFDAALLERAEELLNQAGGVESKRERDAARALGDELSLVSDWAKDSVGNFFTQLPVKLRWAHLKRGQERWHEEAQRREASSGSGWKSVMGNWEGENGWSAQELITPTQLSHEGKSMRHCVGGYSEYCRNGSSRIFAIKKNGVKALTAQFNASKDISAQGELTLVPASWRLAENRGPCNASPSAEGSRATKALGEALQAAWDARVERALAERKNALAQAQSAALEGESAALLEQEGDIPGFNADAALDLARWKSVKQASAIEPPQKPKPQSSVEGVIHKSKGSPWRLE